MFLLMWDDEPIDAFRDEEDARRRLVTLPKEEDHFILPVEDWAIEEWGTSDAEVFCAYLEYMMGQYTDSETALRKAIRNWKEAFCGRWDSLAEFWLNRISDSDGYDDVVKWLENHCLHPLDKSCVDETAVGQDYDLVETSNGSFVFYQEDLL